MDRRGWSGIQNKIAAVVLDVAIRAWFCKAPGQESKACFEVKPFQFSRRVRNPERKHENKRSRALFKTIWPLRCDRVWICESSNTPP